MPDPWDGVVPLEQGFLFELQGYMELGLPHIHYLLCSYGGISLLISGWHCVCLGTANHF